MEIKYKELAQLQKGISILLKLPLTKQSLAIKLSRNQLLIERELELYETKLREIYKKYGDEYGIFSTNEKLENFELVEEKFGKYYYKALSGNSIFNKYKPESYSYDIKEKDDTKKLNDELSEISNVSIELLLTKIKSSEFDNAGIDLSLTETKSAVYILLLPIIIIEE